MLNRSLPALPGDIALLIGRIVLGVVLFAHGWQKLMINGISGTYGQFEKLGIPLAIVSASFTSFVEFVGGALLVVGALTTTVIALDLVVMVGAAGFVHITHGVFAQDGGWELVGVIVAAELALAAAGPGRFSVDHLIASRRHREEQRVQSSLGRTAPEPDPDAFTPVPGSAASRFAPLGPVPDAVRDWVPGSWDLEPAEGAVTDRVPAVPVGALGGPGAVWARSPQSYRSSPSQQADRPPHVPAPGAADTPTGAEPVAGSRDLPPGLTAVVRQNLARRAGDRAVGGAPTPFGVATRSPLDFTPTRAIPVTRPRVGGSSSAEYQPADTEALPANGFGAEALPANGFGAEALPAGRFGPYGAATRAPG